LKIPAAIRRAVNAAGCVAALALLAACAPKGPTPEQLAQRAAAAKAQQMAAQYDAAVTREDFALAQILGNIVLVQYPGSAEAARIRPVYTQIIAAAEQQRDRKRQADLWTYHAVPNKHGVGTVYTGFIWALAAPDSREPSIRLVLRNHPEWGLSAYLLLDRARRPGAPGDSSVPDVGAAHATPPPAGNIAGDRVASPYHCPEPACHISIRFDGGAAQIFTAYEPDERGTGALFIEDYALLTAAIEAAQWMTIDMPTPAGIRELRFEVAGYDPQRLTPALAP
jgi:hypothetical protein